MTATYRSDHAADPVLFERLMRERYGPLDKVMAERDRPRPTTPFRRSVMAPAHQSTPDPDAAEHYAQLKEAAVAVNGQSRTGQHTPPYPGAVWCNSCDGWCTPQGICGCNNR
ncbi:hypothetical protein [Streptomyces sp. NPDC001401]|uniref:hypothetical protein n=1 Tax=Streptomyces sp. NPDC001401 TaxID=3364570 RepID=UPI0036BCFC65